MAVASPVSRCAWPRSRFADRARNPRLSLAGNDRVDERERSRVLPFGNAGFRVCNVIRSRRSLLRVAPRRFAFRSPGSRSNFENNK